jgi:hypothetical protein
MIIDKTMRGIKKERKMRERSTGRVSIRCSTNPD